MHLIVGSNILAWLVAIGLKKFDNKKSVTLANVGLNFGGNSQSFKFRDVFIDRGMQTYYDCGISWADEIVREALKEFQVEYNEFRWPEHDPCITLQQGRLIETVYPVHISNFSAQDYLELFSKLKNEKYLGDELQKRVIQKFGMDIWKKVFSPISRKFTIGDLDELSIVSLAPIPIDRVAALHISDSEIRSSPTLLNSLAIQNTENIPKESYKYRSTIYPKYGGIKSLIDALRSLALRYGVKIQNGINWDDITISRNEIQFLKKSPKLVYWTLPNKHLLALLKSKDTSLLPRPIPGSFVSVFCDLGFCVEKAHYLLSYDNDPIFRITFYGNLAGMHAQSYASVELLQPPQKFDKSFLIDFFKKANLINENASCYFSDPVASPWPMSFPKGYTAHRGREEKFLHSELTNLNLMNSNPGITSIMQTPTLAERLRTVNLR